jgi:PIN domain nuclease of toxin-antitoxin system
METPFSSLEEIRFLSLVSIFEPHLTEEKNKILEKHSSAINYQDQLNERHANQERIRFFNHALSQIDWYDEDLANIIKKEFHILTNRYNNINEVEI